MGPEERISSEIMQIQAEFFDAKIINNFCIL